MDTLKKTALSLCLLATVLLPTAVSAWHGHGYNHGYNYGDNRAWYGTGVGFDVGGFGLFGGDGYYGNGYYNGGYSPYYTDSYGYYPYYSNSCDSCCNSCGYSPDYYNWFIYGY